MPRLLCSIAVALGAWTMPALASGAPCVIVEGPASTDVRTALADRGIPAAAEACPAATLTLSPDGDALTWTLTLPSGVTAERTLDSIQEGAVWVDSMVHHQRLSGLLDPPSDPQQAILSVVEPTVEAVEAPADESGLVRLYPSVYAWREGLPSAEVDAEMTPRTVEGHLIGEEGLEPMWALDRRPRDGRRSGPAFLIQVGDELYVNESAPPAHRSRHYGRLVREGDAGVYQRRICRWVQAGNSGFVRCDVQLRWIDLSSGQVVELNKRALRERLAVHPDLLASFENERRKHAGTMRRYALQLLERQ